MSGSYRFPYVHAGGQGGRWNLPVPLIIGEFPRDSVPLGQALRLVNNSLLYTPDALQSTSMLCVEYLL